MSIDERLRTGLVHNTEHVVPDLERELSATYGRARHRRLARGGALALATAAVVAVTAWAVDLPGRDDVAPVTPDPTPSEATDLVGVHGPLEAGSYALAAWGQQDAAEPLPRLVVEVPEGYFSPGGYAIDAGMDGVTDDELGDLSVWHVTQVPTDPCRHDTAAGVGPRVADLARALVDQTGPSTRPRPVVLDGHRGLSLQVTIPPDLDRSRCTNAAYSLWRTEARGDSALVQTAPGVVNHLWILDVDGTRLVLLVALHPDESTALHQELIAMAESARFAPPGS